MPNIVAGPDGPQEPEPVPETVDTVDPPLASKWPWGVSAFLAVLALALLIWFLWKGWSFILEHDERTEKADYEQLLGLLDRVQTVALFVLGAILGVSVAGSGAAAAGAAALKNKQEAQQQHELARKNQAVAVRNRNTTRLMVTDMARARDLATTIEQHFNMRSADGSRWADASGIQRGTRQGVSYLVAPGGDLEIAASPRLPAVDPVLASLAEQASRLRSDLDRWVDHS